MRTPFGILLTGLVFLFLPIGLSAQNCVAGRLISSENLQPLQNATVIGNGQTTMSNADGFYQICLPHPGTLTLQISCIGYQTVTKSFAVANNQTEIPEIILTPAVVLIDEIVVTATRTDSRLANTPVRVNLITPKMIQNIPAQNADELLKYAPGINYSRPFGIFSTKGIISMRGLSGKEQGRVMVLVDGIPVNKSDGGTVDWNMIDASNVQKIEITKGAGSAIYGGNAMGGVVNIITRKPDKPLYVNTSVEYGTFNTLGGKVNSGGIIPLKKKTSSLSWMANIFARQSDGYITQSEADQQANPYITKSDLHEYGVGTKLAYSFGKYHNIEATGTYYNDRRGTGEKVHQPEGNTTDHDSYSAVLKYRADYPKIKINSAFYLLTENYKKVNEYLKDDYTWYDVLSVRRDMGFFGTATRSAGKNQQITAGFEIKHGGVDAYDKYYTSTDIVYNEGKMLTLALFAQDELKFLHEKLIILAGLRLDKARYYDGSFRIENPSPETMFMINQQVPDMPVQNWKALSPRISAQYKFNKNTRVYTMFARGFRPSVLDDLCRSGRIKGGFKLANPALQPEYLNNFEAGADFAPVENIQTSVSVYYSHGSDFQYYVTNGTTIDMGFGERPVFIRANISEINIYGAESEIKYNPGNKLQLFANYAFTHSQISAYNKISGNDTIDLSGKFLTDVPDHIFSAGISWFPKILNISLMAHYNGSMFINDLNIVDEILLSDKYPAYSTIDLKLWRKFFEKLDVALNIQNLMDTKYYDSKYAVCPGRFSTVQLGYKW